jgi:ubiquinone/menaquinone biosynthesis C-methylase UbiE
MLSGEMFSKTAQYYDLIYTFKDYAHEAGAVRSVIEREHPHARRVLDVGCGTGEHARCLSSASLDSHRWSR